MEICRPTGIFTVACFKQACTLLLFIIKTAEMESEARHAPCSRICSRLGRPSFPLGNLATPSTLDNGPNGMNHVHIKLASRPHMQRAVQVLALALLPFQNTINTPNDIYNLFAEGVFRPCAH